jgi:hypothetical protein
VAEVVVSEGAARKDTLCGNSTLLRTADIGFKKYRGCFGPLGDKLQRGKTEAMKVPAMLIRQNSWSHR